MDEKEKSLSVLGIHHVTAIAGNPQKNYDFYSKILGLRFVKKTVNFDDPFTYHFYFGDESGNPGTILTFFAWTETAPKGKRGKGQLTTTSFSIPQNSVSFWLERLKKFRIQFSGPFKRFNEEVILFEDHDGLELELVASDDKLINGWSNRDIPEDQSIRGFHNVTLSLDRFVKTEELLTGILGFKKIADEGNRTRYRAAGNDAGLYADILNVPDAFPGRMGVGAVHHVAWRIENDERQLKLREQLIKGGFNATPVIDRNYFHSVYFREPGNILFEIATDPPGFLVDEEKETLGRHLKLPSWYEKDRVEIEKTLPPIKMS